MKIMKFSDALKDMERVEVAKGIREGSIFIHPTDTLYGIGCNAEKTKSVEKIIEAKGREKEKPFSIIAPSEEWIAERANLTSKQVEFINNLFPGPYTVVMKVKRSFKMPYVVSSEGKIGVRIPRNRFCDFIRSLGVPFITTSVNISGEEDVITSPEDAPETIKKITDYAINSGQISGHSSRVFDISGGGLKILRW